MIPTRPQTIPRTQYAHGHHTNCVNIPENTAPTRNPAGAVATNRLSTISFLGPGGYVRLSTAIPLGSMIAGPIPCIARQNAKKIKECEKALNPATRDHSANQKYPMTNSFLWPYKSPHLPAGRMKVPTVKE